MDYGSNVQPSRTQLIRNVRRLGISKSTRALTALLHHDRLSMCVCVYNARKARNTRTRLNSDFHIYKFRGVRVCPSLFRASPRVMRESSNARCTFFNGGERINCKSLARINAVSVTVGEFVIFQGASLARSGIYWLRGSVYS